MRPVLCALLLAAALPCLSQTASVNSVDYQGTVVSPAPVASPAAPVQSGLAAPVPTQAQGPAWMYVSSTGLPYDTAAVLEKREEYYSSKSKAVIFSIVGTGLGVVGNVLVQTACKEEETVSGSGYYRYSSTKTVCDNGQLLTGLGVVAGALPFQIIGIVNIIKASVQGGQLKGLENRAGIRDISVDAGWNPQTKATGMVASVRF